MAAHLEECQYFDHSVPSSQFRYCCIVHPGDPGTSDISNHEENTEIGLEYNPGHEGSDSDQIGLECRMSDENTTDTDTETDTETSSSDSESELLEAEN